MDDALSLLSLAHAGAFAAQDAYAAGLDPADLDTAVRTGRLERVRRAAYVDAAVWASAAPEERYRLKVRGILRSRPASAASHHASLALHRLPLWRADLTRVDVIDDVGQAVNRAGLWVHPLRLAPVTTLHGLAVVQPAHAIVRSSLTMGRECGVAAGDQALHTGLVTMEQLEEAVASVTPHQGRRRAIDVLEQLDAAAESVGETRTRLVLTGLGFAVTSQVEIRDPRGGFVARTDFLVEGRVVVEFDGRIKYQGPEGEKALWAEKLREDAIRALGYAVVRLTWSDLDDPRRVLAKVRAALTATA